MAAKTLVSFGNATIRRAGTPVVRDLSLQIKSRDAWVITGPLGAGKTTILDAIAGKIPVQDPETLTYPFLEKKQWPSDVIKILRSNVSPTGDSAYYSERYHSRREASSTLREWLSDDLASTETDPDRVRQDVESVAGKLGLSEYLDASTINLSNGQSKRATIARSLLSKPKVLLLDEPFVGLDVSARSNLASVLGDLLSPSSADAQEIILALRPLDDIPNWSTHILWMNRDGTTRYAGPISSIKADLTAHLDSLRSKIATDRGSLPPATSGDTIVDLIDVNVSYWGTPVLKDVSWTIKQGEKWHLSGSNGSGKTTLLAMILGDHPKLYANEIYLFGIRRGTRDGRSVFEVQRDMGHSSPEIHRHYPRHLTGLACLLSAFSESFYPRPESQVTHGQREKVRDVVRYFGVGHLMTRELGDMAPAEQRLMLLLRAIVKRPKLLVLDEPFAGMDEDMIEKAMRYIDTQVGGDQAVVFVTHYEDEVPRSVTRSIRLDKGVVVEMR